LHGKSDTEIGGSGGFGHAAFLIAHCYDFALFWLFSLCRHFGLSSFFSVYLAAYAVIYFEPTRLSLDSVVLDCFSANIVKAAGLLMGAGI
jgi:hypothetical protein